MKPFHIVPKTEWPHTGGNNPPFEVLKNKDYLVQLYSESWKGATRMTVNRIKRDRKGWRDGITWDQLQEIKRMAGFADHYAIEVYPRDRDMVNVANMRHLWILSEPLPYG